MLEESQIRRGFLFFIVLKASSSLSSWSVGPLDVGSGNITFIVWIFL